MSRGSMAAFALAPLAGLLLAGSAQAYTVYVTNEKGNTVSVIDTATLAVVDAIPVAGFLGVLAVKPDGSRIYGTTGGSLYVIDPVTHGVSVIPLGFTSTEGVAVNPAGTVTENAYVALSRGLSLAGNQAREPCGSPTTNAPSSVGTHPSIEPSGSVTTGGTPVYPTSTTNVEPDGSPVAGVMISS